jgi:hypothetical protein
MKNIIACGWVDKGVNIEFLPISRKVLLRGKSLIKK